MKGVTLLEVLISVGLLLLLISGGLSFYEISVRQMDTAGFLLTEAWLAKGKLDSLTESAEPLLIAHGSFSRPFNAFSFNVARGSLPDEPSLQLLTVEVDGPSQTHVRLEGITFL